MDLVEEIYGVTRTFPNSERFALASQLQRSAVSVPSNIAEGHARSTTREYLRYVSIACGSLAETETHLMIAGRLHYVPSGEVDTMLERADKVGRVLRRLSQALKRKLQQDAP
jgi:four helix bundle protein